MDEYKVLQLDTIWNPWHGCIRYSEGCEHCYMYFLDLQRNKNGADIYKTKTNFRLPLSKTRAGAFKIPAGSTVRVCMTSDFFLAEADIWRDEVWDIIRQRPDVTFFLLTKRAERIRDHLPRDWHDGWDNVELNVTCENQRRADERIPILLDIPAKYKGLMIAPFLGPVNIEPYLADGQIREVSCEGENYDGYRSLHYEWVKSLHDQCAAHQIPFRFYGTGNVFIKDGKEYRMPKAYHRVQALKSGLQYPPVNPDDYRIQPRCAYCERRNSCGGCRWCGRCSS
ncbi:MAG: DUF5131 family protein [Lachnospiraceae bacterium]|nr:DUF5131 family protein [Lachnospiraceae bacterium]